MRPIRIHTKFAICNIMLIASNIINIFAKCFHHFSSKYDFLDPLIIFMCYGEFCISLSRLIINLIFTQSLCCWFLLIYQQNINEFALLNISDKLGDNNFKQELVIGTDRLPYSFGHSNSLA